MMKVQRNSKFHPTKFCSLNCSHGFSHKRVTFHTYLLWYFPSSRGAGDSSHNSALLFLSISACM